VTGFDLIDERVCARGAGARGWRRGRRHIDSAELATSFDEAARTTDPSRARASVDGEEVGTRGDRGFIALGVLREAAAPLPQIRMRAEALG